jgi:hypothetical protein
MFIRHLRIGKYGSGERGTTTGPAKYGPETAAAPTTTIILTPRPV